MQKNAAVPGRIHNRNKNFVFKMHQQSHLFLKSQWNFLCNRIQKHGPSQVESICSPWDCLHKFINVPLNSIILKLGFDRACSDFTASDSFLARANKIILTFLFQLPSNIQSAKFYTIAFFFFNLNLTLINTVPSVGAECFRARLVGKRILNDPECCENPDGA